MSFNFSALRTPTPNDDALLGISRPAAASIVARAIGISIVQAFLLLDDNFPKQDRYRPGAIGDLLNGYFIQYMCPQNAVPSGDPDEHDGE